MVVVADESGKGLEGEAEEGEEDKEGVMTKRPQRALRVCWISRHLTCFVLGS